MNRACNRFPGYYSAPENPSTKKIMLILDAVSVKQMNAMPYLTAENPTSILWMDESHKLLQTILAQLVDENTQLFITHGLKCEAPDSFTRAHRGYIYTSAKEVEKKEASRTWYEQEAPHFQYCMQHLVEEIKSYDPDIIVTFGHRVTSTLVPEAKGIFTSRGIKKEIDLLGKKRLIISTLGIREILLHNHLASQWKVDLGHTMWRASGKIPDGFLDIPKPESMYQIRTVEQFRQLIDYLKASNAFFTWDTETSGLKKVENICYMLSMSFDGLTSYTIPVVADQFLPGHPTAEFEELIVELLSLPAAKCLHNRKFDLEAIATGSIYKKDPGWLPVNCCWDSMEMAYVFEENFGDGEWRAERQPGLTGNTYGDWLSLGCQTTEMVGVYDKEWLAEKADRKDMTQAIMKNGWDAVARYAGKDAIYTYRVWYMYQIIMNRTPVLQKSLNQIANKLLSRECYALTKVERAGLPINIEKIKEMMDPSIPGSIAAEKENAKREFLKCPTVQVYNAKLAKAEAALAKPKAAPRPNLFSSYSRPAIQLAAPEPFNLASNTQLSKFFFDHLGLQPVGDTRSTNKDFIAAYADKCQEVALLKIYREREKILGTFLPGFKDNASQYSDNRVRASYHLTTTTGRTSCTDPNLQQIPRSGEKGNNVKGLVKTVIEARPGYCIIAADYATAEVRVLALVAQDPVLADVFRKVDSYKQEFLKNPTPELYYKMKTESDFHKINASNMMSIPIDQVSKEQRTAAKSLTFMICYAYNPAPNLAGALNISNSEAQKLIDGFLGAYKGVYRWFKDIEAFARENGYINNIFGRRRCLYGLYGGTRDVGHALNMNRNAPVQGAASDWTLLAAYDFQQLTRAAGLDIRIVNLIHDAIYVECPIELASEWAPKLLRTMEAPPSAKLFLTEEQLNFVPMSADCEIGLNQYSMAGWDDTDIHMSMILEWLKNGAKKSDIPESPFEAKK
jgi:DNA polymerase I-like protein with 3'-5' exonuclease and polymerase domains/uracil-DNA glycosylase